MNIESNWGAIRSMFTRAFSSSLHYAMASTTPDGLPHVTPIGSLILRKPGHGIYFEQFTRKMPSYFAENNNVCVLAVRSGLLFWLTSLLRGRFPAPPAIRLYGTVGPSRPATDEELSLWDRRVGKLRFTKGHAMMWATMRTVRDVYFTKAEGVHLGGMTRQCFAAFEE